jgi:hypothetical protein
MNRHPILRLVAAMVVAATMLAPAAAAEAIFPLASQIGLAPPPGMVAARTFFGFEDRQNNVFVRLVALPANAYADIEKTMTSEALRKQGMTVEKREHVQLASGKALLLFAQQDANDRRLHKWLLVAPLGSITALVSFEMPSTAAELYPEAAIRAALNTVAYRSAVPEAERLAQMPFKIGDMAGMRLAGTVPGVALQLTDGPKDSLDAYDQPHLVISAIAGGPKEVRDRDHFARLALAGLPPLKNVRIASAEPMRISGHAGHEIRATAEAPQAGLDIEIVQWLRFGTGAYMRILGIAPKQDWTRNFMRFRTVRDGIGPR